MKKTNCLTPWDVQSRQIYTADGAWMTLYAGQGGGRGYVIYESISNENRSLMCEQPSGELHRTGCIQRYASGDRGGADVNDKKYVLRRLTPLECARLQGFPDWWVDGADGSDSNIYKMWGNGIALPCAADVIGRLAKEMAEEQ